MVDSNNPMSLPIPDLTDSGPSYAQNINTSLTIVAYHTHDGGPASGQVIDLAEQVANGDVSLNNNNLSNVKSVEFVNQPSQLTGSQDVNCLYVNQNQLGFNNSNGIFVPITDGNTLAITSFPLTNFSSRNISATSTILSTDTYNLINVDTSTNNININLPIAVTITPVAANRLYIIRDVAFNAANHRISVHCATGNTFGDSGASNFVITNNGGYVGVYTDGISKWYTFTQNMYNDENVQITGGNLTLLNATQNNTNITTTITGGVIDYSNNTQVLDGSNVTLQGSSLIITDSGGPSSVTVAGTTTVAFNSGTLLNQDAGSLTNLNGTTELNNIFNVDGGIINVDTPNGISINANLGVSCNNPGSVYATVAAAIWDANIPAGILASAVPTGALSSGIALGGGDGCFPCFTNSSGVSAPRSRSIWMPITCVSPMTDWLVGRNGIGLSGGATSTQQNGAIPVVHDGATLNRVVVLFQVLGSHSNISSTVFPSLTVFRQNVTNNVAFSPEPLATFDPQSYPTPASIFAYENGGLYQFLTYNCNQNNIIDTANYLYYIGIVDEHGTGAVSGNDYFSINLQYSNIIDMRWST